MSSPQRLPAQPRIVFMGTPDFAVPSLKALVESGNRVVSVVTQPDRAGGRGRKVTPSPVKRLAVDAGLELFQPVRASDASFCERLGRRRPDILVVVAFGQILKKNLLRVARWGALNIHASLLPKYRGPAPIHWAILNRERKTGLTAMRMDEGLDTGPILLQEEVEIGPEESAGELHDRLAELSGQFVLRVLNGLVENGLEEHPQDSASATYAPKIERRMTEIDWHQPADAISAAIRAFDPWPGAYTVVKGKTVKLFSPGVIDADRAGDPPGRVVGFGQGTLEVETARGLLRIREMQLPGKKRLLTGDFLRGFPIERGTLLGR